MRTKRHFSWLLGACLLGIGQGLVLYFLFVAPGNAPRLAVDTPELDFGVLPQGVRVTRAFRLSNLGDRPLQVRRIHTGCGCISAHLSESNIPPNRSADLAVTMTVENLLNKRVDIYVFTNDPERPIQKLAVRAEALMEAIIEPEVIDFGQIESAAELPLTRQFKLSLNQEYFDGTAVEPIEFIASEPYLIVDASRPANGNTRELEITLSAGAPAGDLCAQLSIGNSAKSAIVRVLGVVRGQHLAIPQMVVLGPASPESGPISQFVEVKLRPQAKSTGDDRAGGAARIEAIAVSAALRPILQVTPVASADRSGIEVTFDPQAYRGAWSSGEINGRIAITCVAPDGRPEILNVPVLLGMRVQKLRND